jgi:uncharacterized protein YndB with AHSA1/START domain
VRIAAPDRVRPARGTSSRHHGLVRAFKPDLRTAGTHGRLIRASPLALFEAVSDIRRMPDWSAECYRCEWLDAGEHAAVGRRFRGRSRTGVMRWAKTCEVTAVEARQLFAFRTLATVLSPSSTDWRFEFTATDQGTWVVESFSIAQIPPSPLMMVIAILAPHHLDMTPDLVATLDRLDRVTAGDPEPLHLRRREQP